MRARDFLIRLKTARARVEGDISGNREGVGREGFFARGLSREGYAGGYLQALDDVDAMLRHGYPNDPRGYWRNDKDRS